ncbi:DNA polymerase III subunit alpha [Plantactinospora sp. S1510]|uniref:DNA-directed DNA polymerase n=1 Tax=Plantactinospora alkalitolerans TaxID=2789879 RepID=A0ABS0H4H4_9ACTN|nr:DNA polymerase III subunit alpha [Plantactinospora alkalitolerans]MBF9133352.1 DNA polymerase III subunit alpha [Plantactinospora alkalitolerans]
MGDSFVHLHVHTEYSMLDGAARLKDLFAETNRLGMPALAMTDHGNLFGAYDFHKQATAAGVKPIIGTELYLTPGTDRRDRTRVRWATGGENDVSGGGAYTHMTALAADADGLRNLMRISSLASLEGFYFKPRADRELLHQYGKGLIATTGCPSGEVQTWLRIGNFDKACASAAEFQDIFGAENYYLEVMDHGLDIERRVREDLIRLGKRLGLKPVATNDLHYTYAKDAATHEILLCVQSGKTLTDPDRFKFDAKDFYLKSAAEMRALWDAEVPGACDNTLEIAERIGDYSEVFAPRNLMPRFPVPDGETEESWLRKEVEHGLNWRYPSGVPDDRRRQAAYELDVILKMGFPGYFLVTADLIAYARREGIRVGPGRGSAAGSLVAYATGITNLDPMTHGLLFERFLNPERVSMPDIDMDFDERRRGDMIRYATEKYGEARVAQIITYGTIKAKAGTKDAARVLGYPFSVGDRATKAMPPAVMGNQVSLADMFDPEAPRYKDAEAFRTLYAEDAEVRRAVDVARGLEGLKRQWGVHAAGVILSRDPLIDVLPIMKRDADGAIITQWDQNGCEGVGLLKMDFLGLDGLTTMGDAEDNIAANRGETVDLDALPLNDKPTYELFARGDTVGIFQFGKEPMRRLLRSMGADRFEDISAAAALNRPGPMGANTHNEYADRKNGRKPVTPIHRELAEPLADILDNTYGLIVYQEQVMAIAQRVAGYSLGGADLLRRAMGKKKKEILAAEFKPFAAGMKANGYSDGAIKTLWDILVPFSDYAFNLAHSAAYGLIAYQMAYLKAHYPAEFMAALLTSVADDKDKRAIYLSECRRMGIKVLPPDVNESRAQFTAVGSDIRFGLASVQGIGANPVEAIISSRPAGGYTSFGQFLHKVDAAACTKKVVEPLIKAGAFDSLGHKRRGLHIEHAAMVDLATKLKKDTSNGQIDLFAIDTPGNDMVPLGLDRPFEPVEWPQDELLANEREALGLYVSGHPLADDGPLVARVSTTTIAALLAAEPHELPGKVTIAGLVTKLEREVSKKGAPYARVTVEDLDGVGVLVLMFNVVYERYGAGLARDMKVVVDASVKRDGEALTLYASRIRPLDQVAGGGGGGGPAEPLTVRVPLHRVTKSLAARLRNIFDRHPGEVPVRIHLTQATKNPILTTPFKVNACAAFHAEVRELLELRQAA